MFKQVQNLVKESYKNRLEAQSESDDSKSDQSKENIDTSDLFKNQKRLGDELLQKEKLRQA